MKLLSPEDVHGMFHTRPWLSQKMWAPRRRGWWDYKEVRERAFFCFYTIIIRNLPFCFGSSSGSYQYYAPFLISRGEGFTDSFIPFPALLKT